MKHPLLFALFCALVRALPPIPLALERGGPRSQVEQERPATAQAALTQERRELAEIRLLVGADRKFAAAKERLAKLKATLAGKADAKDLLAEVTTLEQEVLRALGEATPAADLENQDKVDEAVLEALLNDRYSFIQQLGTRAAPGLMKAVRRTPDELPGEFEHDPFYLLLLCDPLKASALCQELLTQDGFFWKKRALRAMEIRKIQTIDALWSVPPERRYLGEGFLKTLEKYVDDPDVGGQALLLLAYLVNRGATSSVFEASVARALHSQDSARREVGKQAMKIVVLPLRPLLETLLQEKDADLRSFSAELLRGYEDASILLLHADDPVAFVRLSVAVWLGSRDTGSWGESERAALTRLLHDADPEVRKKSWPLLARMPTDDRTVVFPPLLDSDGPVTWTRKVTRTPLPAEVYRSLVGAEERELLPGIAARLDASVCFPILKALAKDPKISGKVADNMLAWPYHDDPPAALEVVATLLDQDSSVGMRNSVTWLCRQLSLTRAGLEATVTWLLQRGDVDLTTGVLVGDLVNGKLQLLDPKIVVASMVQIYPRLGQAVSDFVTRGRGWTSELSAAFLGLAREDAQPLGLRILGLRGALQRGSADAEFLRVASAVLEAPEWRGPDSIEWVRDRFDEGVLKSLYGESRNALVLQVVNDPHLGSLLTTFVDRFESSAPHAGEIVKRVLELWFGKPGGEPAVNRVLSAMRDPALQDRAMLARAARDPAYCRAALEAIGALRDPSYLPLLGEILKESSDFNRRWATEALFGYLDEEAVEPLLLAASKASYPELRDQCLAQLEKIREYQDARARWATRKVQAATRAEVVAELVTLLDAKATETRVQAIRGLATWEAVEVMPRLIALLSDPAKEVAAAAREALARLNAPKGE